MGSELAPLGRSPPPAATSGSRSPPPSVSARLVPRGSARARARGGGRTASATWSRGGWPGEPAARACLTGSHLDSVLEGGAYDGPLGVVSALAAVDLLRERGLAPRGRWASAPSPRRRVPGSRSPAWARGWRPARRLAEQARGLRDRDGVRLLDAIDPRARPGQARPTWVAGSACFLELHVEQGRDLVHRDAAVGRGRRSGRTAATASTSPGPPTTPAPPGWRTGTTRC